MTTHQICLMQIATGGCHFYGHRTIFWGRLRSNTAVIAVFSLSGPTDTTSFSSYDRVV